LDSAQPTGTKWAAVSGGGYSSARITVSPTSGKGDFTTIAAALTAALSGDMILLLEGTYTEDPVLKAGVNIVAWSANGTTPNVIINGKCTFTGAGVVSISGVRLRTNSDNFLTVTGSTNSVVYLRDCYLDCLNNMGISYTSSGSSSFIDIQYCEGNIATTGIALFACSGAGYIKINYSDIKNDGSSTTASTISAGALFSHHTVFNHPVTSSGTASVIATKCAFYSGFGAATALTLGGSGTNTICQAYIPNTSGSCLSVGSGVISSVSDSVFFSSNTNVITGLGTVNYGNIVFGGPSNGVNVSTYSPLYTSMKVYPMTFINNSASPYTISQTDEIISVDCSAGATTVNLPNLTKAGRVIQIKDKTGSSTTNNITVTTPGGTVTIDGQTSYVISLSYQNLQVIFDGTNYEVL
jgi:hypothetical protein